MNNKEEHRIHYCVIFNYNKNVSKSINILSIGYNYLVKNNFKNNEKIKYIPVHAEEDAINKLPKYGKYLKDRNIYMLVVRITKTNEKLYNSKPCSNCIKVINEKITKKGYNIKDIFYSVENNSDGTINKQKFIDLYNDPNKHISTYYSFINSIS